MRLSATLALDGPVSSVKAVSGARVQALADMHITTVRDLVTHFPRRYIDMSHVSTIADAHPDDSYTIVGHVYEVKLKRPRPRLNITEITFTDDTDTMIATCFHQPWLARQIKQGDTFAVSGKMTFSYGFKRMTNPFLEKIDGAGDISHGMIVPVHPATAKLSTAWMRRLVRNALDLIQGIEDPIPLYIRQKYRLYSRGVALENIHFPHRSSERIQARRRLTYEELLYLELHLLERNVFGDEHDAFVAHTVDGPHVQAAESALPFTLTPDQAHAKDDLLHAMASHHRAHHMILGDVGTGKTAVALFGLCAVADTHTQALMMAPTEVLAEQYATKMGPVLDKAHVRWDVLTGSTDTQKRREITSRLADGTLDVLFGTHALLESDVKPKNCSLVVIDEQQRFGVGQRDALFRKGPKADQLSMTATPIPRSLALALYGNMTLSFLHTRPTNHAETKTFVFSRTKRGEAFDIARKEIEAGHQVYVVCPLVNPASMKDPSKKARTSRAQSLPHASTSSRVSSSSRTYASGDQAQDDTYEFSQISIEDAQDFSSISANDQRASATFEAKRLKQAFPSARVGLLHGRLTSEEKMDVMDKFRRHDIDILVSTTVIEVGVDVPNATVMIVEEADRFGLAQLHQLRGRVGRGDAPGYVCLISGSKSPEALSRLSAMEKTNDGFKLAEYDLSLRREGDILGNRQHGASTLKLVNVVRDKKIIDAALNDAKELLARDPYLSEPEHLALRREVRLRFPITPRTGT